MHNKHIQIRREQVALMLTENELGRIDDWGFAKRIRARSDVIRTLVLKQLAQETEPKTL